MQDQQARRIDAGVHVGQHVGDRLMFADFFAELNPLIGIGEGGFECGAGNTQRLGGDADASALQVGQRNGEPLAARTQQVIFGNGAVFKQDGASVRGADTEFVLGRLNIESLGTGRHDERRQSFLSQFRIGDCEYDGHLRTLAVGDELLGPIQDPLAASELCAGLEVVGLRTRLGFGQAKAADLPAGGEIAKIHFLLRLGAPGEYRPASH